MRFLLDTHTFVWMATSPTQLSERARECLAPEHDLILSAVSCWELAIKAKLGRFSVTYPSLDEFVESQISALELRELTVTRRHALGTGDLPLLHNDPFDRLLIAQSRVEGLPLITNDRLIAQYEVETIW